MVAFITLWGFLSVSPQPTTNTWDKGLNLTSESPDSTCSKLSDLILGIFTISKKTHNEFKEKKRKETK